MRETRFLRPSTFTLWCNIIREHITIIIINRMRRVSVGRIGTSLPVKLVKTHPYSRAFTRQLQFGTGATSQKLIIPRTWYSTVSLCLFKRLQVQTRYITSFRHPRTVQLRITSAGRNNTTNRSTRTIYTPPPPSSMIPSDVHLGQGNTVRYIGPILGL